MLCHPGVDLSEVSGSGFRVDVQVFLHAVIIHGIVHIPDGIGLEVAEAVGPVDVLQDAFLVTLRADAEVFLIEAVPLLRQFVINGKPSVHQLLLQLVADDDVEGVGELVGFGPDQGRFDHVYSLIEFLLAYVRENLGEDFAALGVDQVDEGFRAPDPVFVEAGDGLVHGIGLQVVDEVVEIGPGLLLHEESVATFVDDGKHARKEHGGVVVGRDPGVVSSEAVGEGVLGRREGAPLEVVADQVEEVIRHSFLLFVRDFPGEEVGADFLFALLDGGKQRGHALFEGPESLVQVVCRDASLVGV